MSASAQSLCCRRSRRLNLSRRDGARQQGRNLRPHQASPPPLLAQVMTTIYRVLSNMVTSETQRKPLLLSSAGQVLQWAGPANLMTSLSIWMASHCTSKLANTCGPSIGLVAKVPEDCAGNCSTIVSKLSEQATRITMWRLSAQTRSISLRLVVQQRDPSKTMDENLLLSNSHTTL